MRMERPIRDSKVDLNPPEQTQPTRRRRRRRPRHRVWRQNVVP